MFSSRNKTFDCLKINPVNFIKKIYFIKTLHPLQIKVFGPKHHYHSFDSEIKSVCLNYCNYAKE